MGKAHKHKLEEKEKENGCVSSSSKSKDKQLPRTQGSNHDLSLVFKEKVRRRLVKSNESWMKFDSDLKEFKNSLLKIVDIIDACRGIATVERRGNDNLITVLQDKNANAIASKTNVVAPMIRGLPLKKFTISLERLAPTDMQNYQIQSSSTSSASQRSSTRSENRNLRQRHAGTSTSVSDFTRSHSKFSGGGRSHR